MTWTQTINPENGGNGPLEYRLEIIGFDYSFVTSQQMANNNLTVKRVNGLLRDGLKISQDLVLPDMVLKLSSNTFKIVDYQEQATRAFIRRPTFVTRLLTDVETYDYIFPVEGLGNFRVGQILWIGFEAIKVTGLIGGSNSKIVVQRGMLGTTPLKHVVLTNLGLPVKPRIMDIPFTLEKRRCNLYAYGEGDNLQGNGTLIWRGVVNTDVVMSGPTSYSFEAQPITEILNSACGIEGSDIKVRGINLGNWKWIVRAELITNDIQNGTSSESRNIEVEGFYENKWELAKAFDYKLKLFTSSWNVKCGCQITIDGEFVFTMRTTNVANAVRYTLISSPYKYKSPADGETVSNPFELDDGNNVYPFNQVGEVSENNPKRVLESTTTMYAWRLKNPQFPSSLTIYAQQTYPPEYTNAASYPWGKRLYLATDAFPSTINDLVIMESEQNKVIYQTRPYMNDLTYSNAQRFVQATMNSMYTTAESYTADTLIIGDTHKIYLGTSFGTSYARFKSGNVVSFLNKLITVSPNNVTNGTIPLLTNNDFDIADMTKVLNSLSCTSLATHRGYTFYKQIKKLQDFLTEEYKLLGVFPAITADGRITIREFKTVNVHETPDVELDSDDILTDQSYPTIETNKFGITNQINFSTKYNPITDQWDGQSVTINNIDSIAISGKGKALNIKPQSQYEFEIGKYTNLDYRDIAETIDKSLCMLAFPYWILSLDVPIKYFNVPLGASVRVINKQIPNFAPMLSYITTRRGTNKLAGTIIGKSFDLGKGFGSLKILVSEKEYPDAESPAQKFVISPDGFLDNTITSNPMIFSLGNGLYKIKVPNYYPYFADYTQPEVAVSTPTVNSFGSYWSVGDAMKFEEIGSTSDTANNARNTGYGKVIDIQTISSSFGAYTQEVVINTNYPYSAPTNFSATTKRFLFKVPDYNYTFIDAVHRTYGFIDSGYVDSDQTNRCVGGLSRVLSP